MQPFRGRVLATGFFKCCFFGECFDERLGVHAGNGEQDKADWDMNQFCTCLQRFKY